MPCISRVILATATVKMENVEPEVMREALRLMYPQGQVSIVKDYAANSLTLRVGGRTTTVILGENGIQAVGDEAKRIGADVEQYYLAVVRAIVMRNEGYQTEVQVIGDKIRIQARG
jgi:hypothetical protein